MLVNTHMGQANYQVTCDTKAVSVTWEVIVSNLWGSGGITALVGGAGKLGTLGTRGMVGGQCVGWCDQRDLVPTTSTPTGSSWGWEGCWRKAAHKKESAFVTKGLISWSLVSLWCLPGKGSVVDTLHRPRLSITSVVSVFVSTFICMVFSKTANSNFAPRTFFF